jgi:hypothetical protein
MLNTIAFSMEEDVQAAQGARRLEQGAKLRSPNFYCPLQWLAAVLLIGIQEVGGLHSKATNFGAVFEDAKSCDS